MDITTTLNKYQRAAEAKGWKIIYIDGGTYFAKAPDQSYSTDSRGQAAWQELCILAGIQVPA